jgi:alanine racemase
MMHESSTASLRAWIEVDLGALVRNARALEAHAGVPLIAMVKADAYGLGAVPVTHALASARPWGFGVATVPEGAELRAAGVADRIVAFTPLLPVEFAAARAARVTPTLGDAQALRAWVREGGAWQLSVDTGMQRSGIRWDRMADITDIVRVSPPEAVFTHYHSPERDDGSIAEQDQRFEAALARMPERPELTHTDNSAAIVRRAKQLHRLVRPGVFLYGVGSGPRVLVPEPVVSVRARILELRDVLPGESVSYGATWRAPERRRIATVAAGYADGYRRHLSNAGRGLLRGREVRVAGIVTMDMTLFDVTGIDCHTGDVVTLVGRDGASQLTVEDVARDGGLSAYEFLTGLRQRLPRVYLPPAAASSQ